MTPEPYGWGGPAGANAPVPPRGSAHSFGALANQGSVFNAALSSAARAAGRFRNDRRAAAAIEFALVILPFLAFVLIIMQVAVYHFALQSLDNATQLAAREIMVGAVPTSAKTLQGFKTGVICPKLLINVSCANMIVNVYKVAATSNENANTGIYQFIDSQAKAVRAPPAQSVFCLGGPSDYIFLDVRYTFPNFLGNLLSAGGASQGFPMRSSTFFRNEPFPGLPSSC